MTEETGVNLSESMVLKSMFNWMQTNLGYLILNSINFLSELLFPNRLPWKALCLLYHKMPEVLSCDNSESRSSGVGLTCPCVRHFKSLSAGNVLSHNTWSILHRPTDSDVRVTASRTWGLHHILTSLSILSKSSLQRVYSGIVSDILGCRFLLAGPGCSPSWASGSSSPNICCWCGWTALKGILQSRVRKAVP